MLFPGITTCPTVTVTFHTRTPVTLSVYCADTLWKKIVGLGNMDSLPTDKGLLFEFSSGGPHTIGMRLMNFPIDVIFISDSGTVTDVTTLTAPDSKLLSVLFHDTVEQHGKYVIEVNAGWADNYDITPGTDVSIPDV